MSKDYRDDNVWLIHGDCLERMKEIEKGTVQLILTDPPYGTTACNWDVIIPFEKMWDEIWSVLDENGSCSLFGTDPFSSLMKVSQLDNYKYDWIWVKSRKNGFVHAKGMPLRQTENIHVFSKASIRRNSKSPMRYFPQGVQDIQIERVNYVKTTQTNRGGNKVGTKYRQTGIGYPVNMIQFKGVGTKEQIHPTQKPVELLEYLIKTYTNEGDTVLDFTMGSGSTGVACRNLNRKFIGVELDLDYFNIAKERILGGVDE